MEARQAGTAAPALDKERGGEMINPHNPEFLTKKPWYLGDDAGPTLSHQGVGSTPVGEVSLAEAEADDAQDEALSPPGRPRRPVMVHLWYLSAPGSKPCDEGKPPTSPAR